MKPFFYALVLLFSVSCFGQNATVDVSLTPAGSFKLKCDDVNGYAQKSGDSFTAKDILVGLKTLQTGISLRDTHTKKHLEVDKYPEAILVSAKGQGGKGTGVVKIKGIQQNVSGTYKVDGKQLVASFKLKLSDFKINDIKYMGVGVDDEVTVNVTVPVKN